MSNNRKIDLSIIIISYNNFFLLEKCIESIIKYTNKLAYEIIVVDNNSTEKGLDDLLQGYDNIILIKNRENYGFAKANNIGVKKANGEFILLLNNDTEFFEDSLDQLVETMFENNRARICAFQLLNSDFSNQKSAYKFPTIFRLISSNFFLEIFFPKSNLFNKYYLEIESEEKPVKVEAVIGAFMLMRKSLFEKLGGFDEKFFFYHEDTDLCRRLNSLGGEVFYFPNKKIIHVGGGSTNNLKWFQLKNKVIARFKYFRKHHNFIYFSIIYVIEFIGNILRFIIFGLIGITTFNKSKLKLSTYYFKTLFLSDKSA